MSEPTALKIRPPHEAARYLLDHLDQIGTDAAKAIALTLIAEDLLAAYARLRQELDEARAEIARLQEHEQTRAQVIADHQGRLIAARDVAAERDRMRPVVEAAEQYRRLYATDLTRETCYLPHRQRALLEAVDAYRSATPDAAPAPGTPVDTEATP